jgi:RNA recognition motif-containing protein
MNNKLYVGNLPFTAEEAQLKALFSADGRTVVSVKIPIDKHTKRSRGFAFVEMGSIEDAQSAIEKLNGKDLLGRSLSVTEARAESRSDSDEGSGLRPGGFGGRGDGVRGGRRGRPS